MKNGGYNEVKKKQMDQTLNFVYIFMQFVQVREKSETSGVI